MPDEEKPEAPHVVEPLREDDIDGPGLCVPYQMPSSS
jgi:hypothetical protein